MISDNHISNKITVITVCYNAVNLIEDTIKSVLAQTYSNIEYIIIDGGSTDGTRDIIEKYSTRLAKYISEPDSGIYDAMNKGVKYASGDYINFMNAGDVFFDKDAITRIFGGGPYDETLVYGDTLEKSDKGYAFRKASRIAPMPACHQSMFVATEEMRRHPFDTTFKVFADRDFLRKLYERGCTERYIPSIVSIFDVSGISNSAVYKYWFYLEIRRAHGISSVSRMKYVKYVISKYLNIHVFARIPWIIGLWNKEYSRSLAEKKANQPRPLSDFNPAV